MESQRFYTRQSLADHCGISVCQLDRHIKAGTCRLNKAAERIPGVGIRINGQLAARFIQVMQAKQPTRLQTHVSI